MGLFKTIGSFVGAFKSALSQGKEYSRYKCMSREELLALDDDELYSAADLIFSLDSDEIDKFNDKQRTAASVLAFYSEVNNGGLCQFFVNSSSAFAPYVSESLGIIGETQIKKLFDDFVDVNAIDLTDLSSFKIDDISEFHEQNEWYPFDAFDTEFYKIQQTGLIPFIRKNISEIIIDD